MGVWGGGVGEELVCGGEAAGVMCGSCRHEIIFNLFWGGGGRGSFS